MTDEQLNNTLCLVVVSWERRRLLITSLFLLLGCSKELHPINNTVFRYDSVSKDICRMVDDNCVPLNGQVLYSDPSCKKVFIGQVVPDADLPDGLSVKNMQVDGEVYELGDIAYISKGTILYTKTERGCEDSLFTVDSVRYKTIKNSN